MCVGKTELNKLQREWKAEMIEEVESVFYECLIQLLFEKFEER